MTPRDDRKTTKSLPGILRDLGMGIESLNGLGRNLEAEADGRGSHTVVQTSHDIYIPAASQDGFKRNLRAGADGKSHIMAQTSHDICIPVTSQDGFERNLGAGADGKSRIVAQTSHDICIPVTSRDGFEKPPRLDTHEGNRNQLGI